MISDQKVFCAGADLADIRGYVDVPGGPDRMYAYVAGIQRLYQRITNCRKSHLRRSAEPQWVADLSWRSLATCALPRPM